MTLFFKLWLLQRWSYNQKNGDGDGNKDVELIALSETVSGRQQSWQDKCELGDEASRAKVRPAA